MKNLLFFLFALCLLGCHSSRKGSSSKASQHVKSIEDQLNGSWIVQNMWGIDSSKIKGAFITLDYATKSFSGSTGCNDISGNFSYTPDLSFFNKNISLTKNKCLSYNDKLFINLLLKINRFNIDSNTLELSRDDLVLISLSKKD